MQPPKVSVIVTAYNHEKYISQCLESILEQRCDFTVEVILGDDLSSDGTRRIMEGLAGKYPGKFKMLPSQTNLGVTRNIQRCLAACTGDYIAFCEGDDYWSDNRKLQKQVEYLESHPEYVACFNAVNLYYEDEGRYRAHKDQLDLKKEAISIEDLIECNYIGNFSCCMYHASTLQKLPQSIFDIYTVDWLFNMACGKLGKIGFIRDYMSVYRIHSQGVWSGKTREEQRSGLLSLADTYNKYFNYEYDEQFLRKKDIIKRQYAAGRLGRAYESMRKSMLNRLRRRIKPERKGGQ
ncbi:MAG: glycosyltransferase [Dehalococcoidia bacterium]